MTDSDEEVVIHEDHPHDSEASEEDVAEQMTPANPAEEVVEVHRGPEVAEWDAVEQAHVVDLDEDYR